MTLSRKILPALTALLVLASAPAFGQTEEAARILADAGGGVLGLVIYGADKAETAKTSALALAEDLAAASYHAISQAFDVEAFNIKGKKVKLDGLAGVDKAHDIALLRLKGKAEPLAPAAEDISGLKAGARLFALGTDRNGQITVSEGTFRRILEVAPGIKVIDMSLSAPDEFSGGPILGVDGKVLGMMMVLDRGIKVGLPIAFAANVPKSARTTDFKSMERENYFETFEGASLAGRIAAAMDETTSARMHLETAVKLNPQFIEGFWLLGDVYDGQRDYASAVGAYRKVTELDGSRADAFYRLGSVLAKMRNGQEAVAAMEKAISLNIDSKEIYFELGDTYESMQDWDKAAAAYEKFIGLKPEVAWNGYLKLGLCRLEQKQYEAAVAAFLEARKAKPEDVKVNYSLADAYEKAGQLDKAEEVYYGLARINPAEAKSYYSQALRMYNVAHDYAKAIGPAKKIVELEPDNVENIYNLGLMYFQVQNYAEAVTAFKQCLTVRPEMANAWFQIGGAYYNEKKYPEAIEAYTKFTEMSPEEANGWLSLGVCYMLLKKFEAALEPMKKAVELTPQNPNALYNLAIVYLNLKDTYSAKDIYNKLLGLDPATAEKLKKYLR